MIMISLIKNKFHFTCQCTVLFIILKNHFVKVYLHFDILIGFYSFYRNTFEVTSQKFHMSSIQQFTFKRVTATFFLHNMNIKRLYQQTDFGSYFEMMIILYEEFITSAKHGHFIVDTFKNRGLNNTSQLRHIRNGEDIKVFRTNDYIYRSILTKTFIHTFKFRTTETYQFVMYHRTVKNIAFSDKIRHKRIDRLIININRRTDLLNLSLTHYDDSITQSQCFLLIVSYIYKCNTQRFMHFLEFHLHILTHFQIECSQRFIQKQYFRLIDNSPSNSHTLLLTAGKRIDITVFIIRHTYHFQSSFHLLPNSLFGCLFQL